MRLRWKDSSACRGQTEGLPLPNEKKNASEKPFCLPSGQGASERRTWWRWGGLFLFLALLLLLTAVAQALLTPHIRKDAPESFLLKEYFESDGNHDVIFLGDCEVYEAFSPAVLWEDYGIESWVCGTPQQLLWHSYTILEEILRRETPRVVVLGVYALSYDEPQSEAYNRMALEALPCTGNKWRGVRVAMTEGESILSYFVPLLRYHDRWQSLSWQDVRSLFEMQEKISTHGFVVRPEVVAGATRPGHEDAPLIPQTSFGQMPLAYLQKIEALCREQNIQLILVKAPTDSWRYPWYEEYENWTEGLAAEMVVPYYNFLEAYDEIGLDREKDSCDGGFHLNVSGAEKLTRYFGAILSECYGVPDRRGEKELAKEWEATLTQYNKWKESGKETPAE